MPNPILPGHVPHTNPVIIREFAKAVHDIELTDDELALVIGRVVINTYIPPTDPVGDAVMRVKADRAASPTE